MEQARDRGGHNQNICLVAVTKTHPAAVIRNAVDAGIGHIGENRVQEADRKFRELPAEPSPVKHLIGHLQSNKVNKALLLFDRIDSVDSVRLAEKISRKIQEPDRRIPVLLEVNTSGELSKSGFAPEQTEDMISILELPGLQVEGLMTIGPLTDNKRAIRSSFARLRSLLEEINRNRPSDYPELKTLSMGMSSDFELAIEEGSTMIRLGTALFGPREPRI
ncbi:MAG: YggS family pyridoxal phosphate-dependent enzyme [Candidatus Neomarinimicrobiota bacterium]|nr:MAG: YggS family pyridoxal phosphate-dependent enzyme [Candidatus Neomarinimicrobiota bacterium]